MPPKSPQGRQPRKSGGSSPKKELSSLSLKSEPGSAKNKKLSKSEKEKLKKEEDEQKTKDEEEARLKAEQEDLVTKEEEKKVAAERRRLEQEERKERVTQLDRLAEILDSHISVVNDIHNARRKKAKWERYMLCDGSPDPTIPGEINTYHNLWRDENEHISITDVLLDSKLVLALIEELNFVLEDTPQEDLLDSEVAQYRGTILEMQRLLQDKIDVACHRLLLEATNKASTETLNFECVEGNQTIKMCLWGNLSKNPRIKFFEFKEEGFGFEIPKILTLSDVAIEVLFTKFDHLSHLCKSFLPRLKKKVVEEVVEEKEEPTEQKPEKEEGPAGQPEIEREETEDVMAALDGLKAGNEEVEEKEPEPEEEELPPEDEGMKTPEPLEYEEFDEDEDVVDLRAFVPLGSIMHFNLLNMPPQPKHVNSWIMTEVDQHGLQHCAYMADTVNPEVIKEKEKEKEDKDKNGDEGEKKREDRPPIGVTIKLPTDVCFFEEPQPARWDDKHKHWRLDGFTDIKFDEDNRIFNFKTAYFGTLALFQDTYVNMPFQSWEVRPHGANSALLTIIAAIAEVQIEIKDDLCCLNQPEKPELESIINKWVTPAELSRMMKLAGLNVFPSEDSTRYCDITSKKALTEDRLYKQMALTLSCMAYTRSQWNSQCSDVNKVVVQATECLKDEPPLEEDWSLFMMTKVRTTKLKMSEYDDAFTEEQADGTHLFADMYHMVEDIVSEEGKKRLRETNYKFYDAIYQILSSTKVLTYS